MYCDRCGEYKDDESTRCRNCGPDSRFTDSLVIGAITDSAILGGILGGSLTGGILGDALNGGLDDAED